jgi:hypothetical protein
MKQLLRSKLRLLSIHIHGHTALRIDGLVIDGYEPDILSPLCQIRT